MTKYLHIKRNEEERLVVNGKLFSPFSTYL